MSSFNSTKIVLSSLLANLLFEVINQLRKKDQHIKDNANNSTTLTEKPTLRLDN